MTVHAPRLEVLWTCFRNPGLILAAISPVFDAALTQCFLLLVLASSRHAKKVRKDFRAKLVHILV